ncbi:MAG: DNA repair protein RecN [Bacteroidota bacterium]|nr:DNA repair protein RecN [Bacteroidota bacterium]
MLYKLSIHNYAIIDELEISFASSLSVITGETGAGKSIIVGALGLILGERADTGVLLNRDKKCIVEGTFNYNGSNKNVIQFLKNHELDDQDEVVVRREISPNGKSRAFINDTPVNLHQLNQLGKILVDLHQQFDTQELGESSFQREVLDALAGNASLIKNYQLLFQQSQELKKQLYQLREQKTNFNKEYDYYQFQYNELEEVALKPNELEEIEQELKMLSNAEGIKTALAKAYFDLEEGDDPVVKKIKTIISGFNQYQDIHPQLPSVIERLQSLQIELQDLADEVNRINNHIDADAKKTELLTERLSAGYKLLKKHNVKFTNDLISIQNQLQEKLTAVLLIDDKIETIERSYGEILIKVEEIAEKLSALRKAQIKPLDQQVHKMLVQVGMPNARLKVEIKPSTLNAFGKDEIEFLFDANKSNQFQPLRKVASGGELSRLMLCIKSLIARSMKLPTLIFDEIDTGISGEAAKQVGVIMKDLSQVLQVICITHQPQIAGKADAHFMVYKAIKGDAITTGVSKLTIDERIVAIAKMLSGEKPTAAALENAREMVMN